MSASIKQPQLSAAQIMADLHSLNNCDSDAAAALLKASKNLSPRQIRRLSRASVMPDKPKFDSLGKRIVGSIPATPTMSRMNSSHSSSNRNGLNSERSGSGSSTGLSVNRATGLENPYEKDGDMRRAKELVDLYEKKENFRHMGTTGLGRAKEKVDEVVRNYAQKELDERQRVAMERQLSIR